MEKPKSKGDLRAAGKKRLEEFRQKKQQKGSSNKSSSTAMKALADDDKFLSGTSAAPGGSVTQQDNELHTESDGQGSNLTDKLELEVEPPQQVQYFAEDSLVPVDSKTESQSLIGKKPVGSEHVREFEATNSEDSPGNSELVTKSISSDQTSGADCESNGGETSDCSKDSKVSPVVFGFGQFRQEGLSTNGITGESRQDNSSYETSDVQTLEEDGREVPTPGKNTPVLLQEATKATFITEIEALKRQLQNLVEQKDLVSNQLEVKSEQQLEDAGKVKSLIADLESIQQELNSVKTEKVQLIEEFALSQKKLQNSNRHLASELMASQEQVVAANHRVSFLSEDLERAKQEVVEANAKLANEMESRQSLLKGVDQRIAQLVEELTNIKMLFQGLEDEKASLNDELRRFENELHIYSEELLQKGNELDGSNQRIVTLEQDLATEKRTVQQVQGLVAEKSRLAEGCRVSNEKLEALVLAKEAELGSYIFQIRHMELEKLELVHQVEEFKLQLDNARQKEEGVSADLEAQCKANQVQLKQLEDDKVELSAELEKLELLSRRLGDENSSLTVTFDAASRGLEELKQLREDLRKRDEENLKQSNQLLQSSQELQKLRDDHAQVVKEMEIALDKSRTDLDRETVEKSKAMQELMCARDQLLLSIEEKGQEVVSLGSQLQVCIDQLRTKVEENFSLMTLLDESRGELQKTARCAFEFETELAKHRAVSDGLLEEKGSLEAEVLEVRAQYELKQQNANEYGLELERVRENLRSLAEDYSKLSSHSLMATDELTKLRTGKEAVGLELVAYREQVTNLEEQNSNMVKLLEDTQNELQRVRENNSLPSSDLVSELDQQRVLCLVLLLEKERLASELQFAIEQSQRFQQEMTQGKERMSELEELQKHLKELQQSDSKSRNALTVSESEMSKLKEEYSLAELQLAGYKEQLTKSEDVNKDLIGLCNRHREQLDAVFDEKQKLLADHGVELDKFREQQKLAEETDSKQTAHLKQLLSDLQELKNEKIKVGLELEAYKEQYRELGDENWKVQAEFSKCKDQLQVLIDLKTLAESILQESEEKERKLRERDVLLKTELEDQMERQQAILEQKVNEVEKLEQQVKELLQSQEQMTRELSERQEQSQLLEGARLELLSNVGELSIKLNNSSEENDVLQSDLKVSERQREELVEEKQQLILILEGSSENWKAERLQLSRDLEVSSEDFQLLSAGKVQLDFEVAELTRKAHDLDAQRVQLAMEVRALKKLSDSSDEQRAHLASEVEGKDQLLQTLAVAKSQLESHLQIEREKATVINDQLMQLTETFRKTRLRIEELELETAQSRADLKYSQTQVELLTEEKSKFTEEILNHLWKREQSQQVHEEIQGMRHVIASQDAQVDQLMTQCKVLQTDLELSNRERCDLAQDLAFLKHQLHQISEPKAHGGHQPAQSVACKQRELGNEEMKPDSSSLKVEKVTQDLHVVADEEQDTGEDTQEPAHEVQSLQKLEEISQNLGQELRETFSLVGYVRLEFENQTEQLNNALEELEGKQQQLDTTLVRVDELDSQVKELTENACNLQADKVMALEALYAAQEELRQSKNSLVEERALLEDHLRVLEETAAALQVERDELAGKVVSIEKSHTDLVEAALQDSKEKLNLQDQVAAFEVRGAEFNTELRNHNDMVTQSNLLVQSLVQKLEDIICDAFPEAGQELLSSQCKDAADYHNSLTSRLHIETTEVCHQLQNADVQLSEMNKQLKEADDQSMRLGKERTMAVETAEQIRSQLMKVVEGKEELQNSLRKLEVLLSAANEGVEERATDFASLQIERDYLARKLATLEQSHTHLSERALQDSNDKVSLQDRVTTFEAQARDYRTELGNQEDMVTQSNVLVQFLVQKLEDVLCDSFPTTAQELLSSQSNKDSAEYHNSLASRLQIEVRAVCHQLQNAHVQLSEMNKQLQEAEDQSMRLEKERIMAVGTAEQIRSELMKAAEEKEEFETSLKRLETMVSAENLKVGEQAITFANQASEVEGLVLQIQSLNKQLEKANAEKENLETGLAEAEQKLSATREKLSLAVNKGKAVVQQRDAWKVSLAKKSKELEMLVVGHEQDLQDKDAALKNAERKLVDLTVSLDSMAGLGIQLESVQQMVSTAERVFLENEDLVHSLCAALDYTILPDDWLSSGLAKKILWISSCVRKLLQELAKRSEEMQVLMEHAAALTSTVDKVEARVTAVGLELNSVKQEKEELALRLEEKGNQLQLERDQMIEEKAQLTGIIRQQDLDIIMQQREKEDFATRLQEQAKEIAKLDATVNTLSRNLSDCYVALSPVQLDAISAHSSLDLCKYVVKLLIDNHNLTVLSLKETLESLLSHSSEETVRDGLFQSRDDGTSSKEISHALIERIEEALASLEQQAIILIGEQREKNRLQLELTQKEERLNAVREKLGAAVSKGKSLVQQRDSLKQALMDKNAELEMLAIAHKEELLSKELLLQEGSDRLTSSLEHSASLEKDFASFKDSVANNPEPSLVERFSEMDRQLSETQHRANVAESELENSKNAAAVLLSNLELSQTRLDNLVEDVNSLTKDKNELVQQLESAGVKFRFELQELTTERTQLVSEIRNLKWDLAMGKEEREKLVQDYKEVSGKCDELRSQTEEILTARAILLSETETLQQKTAELKMALDNEANARMQLELEADAIVAMIRKSAGGPVGERSIEPMTSFPHDSQSTRQLSSLSAFLVVRYDAALEEVQELSKQKALLSESQRTMMEKASSEREMLEQLQQRLAAKDVELSELHKKTKEVHSRKEEEEDASKGALEEMGMLKDELAKARSDRDALQSELVQLEQKGSTTREKLSLAIKKGKGVAQQRDLLKQSLSEQQSLVAHYKDELQNKDLSLRKATDEVCIYEEKIQALELNVSSLRSSASTFERELQRKDSLMKKFEDVFAKWDFPSEWQSRDITEKLEGLVGAVSKAESNVIRASEEIDALRKASAQLSSDLKDAQRMANREQELQSALGVKLEESLNELERSGNRISELETLLTESGGVGQQTEQLTREVLDLKRLLQQKQAEGDRADEAVTAWVKRSEESEKYIQLCRERILELEQTVQESVGAHQQIELYSDKLARLEDAVQQKEAAVKAMETSRGKAINKLTLTTNKFRELYQQSEGLVVELERMHKNLQDKDAEIAQLKEEVANISSQSQLSQKILESKMAFQLHLEKLLETAVFSGADPFSSPPMAEQEDNEQLTVEESDEERCIAQVNLLRNQLFGLTVESQARQADVERKEVQLQGMRKELEEVIAERALLNANLQREQTQSERLEAEIASMQAPLIERGANQAEEIEEVQVGKRLLPINIPTPHVRGGRRPNPIDVAIDVDSKMTQSPVEFDDKGHGFKSLASSRFIPRGTRAIGEQIDRLCVAGGRVLMRRPAARLTVTLYWLAIHIWMVFLISAAHI